MTSRRPISRSYSGNGRSNSLNEEDSAPSSRADSRNYLSNVRPENRSTFCTVMSQLTEETQPCFETTMKSKAVSESCNVKFTCVVTGYPAPELTWYKDDVELDRYCGLPKYEIARNGKAHTLHIYNCTLDDAAIYQASARNSKGIVSSSGVLEVGEMSEYKIHQRFFAKLKQKGDQKRREMEESRRRGKENKQQEQLTILTQDRIMRKRRTPGGADSLNSSDSAQEAEEMAEETTPSEETNGEAMETATMKTSDTIQENGNQEVNHVSDMVDIVTTKPPCKEKLGKKKIRISNGFEEGVVISGQTDSGPGNEKHTSEEDMSLARYLSESLQSQAIEDKQCSAMVQTSMEVDAAAQQEKEKEIEHEKEREHEKEMEHEKERQREMERELEKERARLRKEEAEQTHREKEKEKERAQEMERARQMVEAKKTAGKAESKQSSKKSNSEPQQKSTFTSVLTSLKDIFFGKSKSKSIEAPEETQSVHGTSWERDYPPAPPDPYPYSPPVYSEQPATATEACYVPAEQTTAIEVDEQPICTSDKTVEDVAEGSRTPELPQSLRSFDSRGIRGADTEDLSLAPQRPPEVSTEEHLVAKEEAAGSTEEVGPSLKEVPSPPTPTPPPPQIQLEALDDHAQSGRYESPVQEGNATAVWEYDTEERACFTESVTGDTGDMLSLQGLSGESVQTPGPSLKGQVALNLESTDSRGTTSHFPITTEPEKEEEMHVDESVVECDYTKQRADTTSPSGERPEPSESGLEGDTAIAESGSDVSTTVVEEGSIAAGGSVEESEEKAREESESKKVETSLEERSLNYKGDVLEVSSVTPHLDVRVDNPENMLTVPSAGLNKDGSRDSVDEGQKCDSSATEKVGVEVQMEEEMEAEVCTEEPTEVQPKEPHYQMTTPVIIPPALELQAETETENERKVLSLTKENTTEICEEPPSQENVTVTDVPYSPPSKVPDIIIVHEETQDQQRVNMSSINILITEPEEPEPVVSLPSHSAGLQGDAIQLSDPMIVEPNATVVSPTPKRTEDVGVLPPMKDMQEVVQQHERERMSLGKEPEPVRTSRQLDSSSIPIINIAEADDAISSHEVQHNAVVVSVASTTAPQEEPPKKPAFVSPPVAITCVDSSPEIIKVDKKESEMESLAAMLWGVKNNIDQESNVAVPEKAKEPPMTESVSALPLRIPQPAETELMIPVPTLQAKTPQISKSGTDKMDLPKEHDDGVDQLKKDKPAVEKLGVTAPLSPMMSPSSLRRLMAKGLFDSQTVTSIPAITVDSEGKGDENSGGSTPTSILSCESSPKLRRKDSPSPIPSATPAELASGARRKIFLSKAKAEEAEGLALPEAQVKREAPYMSPSLARRAAYLQAHPGQQTPPMEKRSPLVSRRKATLEVPKVQETPEETEPAKTETKPAEKLDPFKAPQVIRKIRGEPFSDATGHLKLWCQFFNVLSDSTIIWYRDEEELLEVKRSAGDESQVALAIVQASSRDCGVYACTIKNKYGTDTTDILLSTDILAEFLLRDDLEVGEEIEMTPLMFTKGLADPGNWGEKLFGRIMTEEMHLGEGWAHKACRVKVIYGLDPIFESGSTCIAKVRNLIAYGTKEESQLIERNLVITKQLCRMQNIIREYCKIFAAEARVVENFGPALEVNPVYLMYRPANTVPYAMVEAELKGVYLRYCFKDASGRLVTRTISEVEQKCSAFQHWIYHWTNGNLLVTQLEGVDMKVTNIRIATKTKGYQGLTEEASPKVLEQFLTQHQCNYYCGLMGLRSLKPMDLLQQPTKMKASRSPLLNRRAGGSSSPQLQRKGTGSPQTVRRITSSPKVVRKTGEVGGDSAKHKTVEIPKVVRLR
ncbi:alpha-protein kinase 3 isoform X2 [Clupea harengus]|uniref:non-specific serine/threonine protein kinase n=1 Tax=Clupea harengus TaxID=7950 RepID=A0A6P3W3N5_CLUHA|nr:alpha-protein kinase 3 isoform X2 [Clupea harengus]